MYTVYKHINKLNGKVYVGQTSLGVNDRWKNGKGYKNGIFRNAIKKYGWDNFEHIIVKENISKKEADLLETALIKEYKELGLSYNITDGGEGAPGYRHTKETRKKMSAKSKGRKFPEHVKLMVSARFKGVPFTEEHKLKISIALRGRRKSEEARLKMKLSHNYHDLVKIVKCDKIGNIICTYPSIAEASRDTGVLQTHISRCARGKRPSAGGFKWKYKDETT